MLVPIVYTTYKHSKLASFVSILASVILAAGVGFGVMGFSEGEYEVLVATAVCVGVWMLLDRLAEGIAARKERKMQVRQLSN